MAYKRVTLLLSLTSCTNFHVNYLLLWGRKNCPDNVITDVLSQSYLKSLFEKTCLASFNFIFHQHQTGMPSFGLRHIDRCINSGLPRECGALIMSARYQVQRPNVTYSLCEIDWGDRGKQILSTDELSYRKMKRKSKNWEKVTEAFFFCLWPCVPASEKIKWN